VTVRLSRKHKALNSYPNTAPPPKKNQIILEKLLTASKGGCATKPSSHFYLLEVLFPGGLHRHQAGRKNTFGIFKITLNFLLKFTSIQKTNFFQD
jgi:hypothetical protein